MPVPGDELYGLPIRVRQLSTESQSQHDEHDDHSRRHMQSVEADQRVIRRAEQVATDREPVVLHQLRHS